MPRQGEAAEAANADARDVPPSKAAKPKTDAAETNGTLKTPSPEKTSAEGEKAASASPPAYRRRGRQQGRTRGREGGEAAQVADGQDRAGFASRRRNCCAASQLAPPARRPRAAKKPSLDDPNRPAGIEKPAAVDDLKLISGVGPKIEGILHSLGIYTFAQIACWKKAERAWVDGYLNFKGRIERDDWVKQAKALAKGGVDEYIRVFGKKPV